MDLASRRTRKAETAEKHRDQEERGVEIFRIAMPIARHRRLDRNDGPDPWWMKTFNEELMLRMVPIPEMDENI